MRTNDFSFLLIESQTVLLNLSHYENKSWNNHITNKKQYHQIGIAQISRVKR